jgi:hypothetical protein
LRYEFYLSRNSDNKQRQKERKTERKTDRKKDRKKETEIFKLKLDTIHAGSVSQ